MKTSSLYLVFITTFINLGNILQLFPNGRKTVWFTNLFLPQVSFFLGTILDYLEKDPDANRYELLRGVALGLAYLNGSVYAFGYLSG